jgi:hypothetical protein
MGNQCSRNIPPPVRVAGVPLQCLPQALFPCGALLPSSTKWHIPK